MENDTILIYDGSFDGFLTCVFQVFEQRRRVSEIYTEGETQQAIFARPEIVVTNLQQAERVKKGLQKKLDPRGRRHLYFSFLSEVPGIELTLLNYIQLVFKSENFSSQDYGNPLILKISQTAKKVSREKHRMEAFVRFMLTKDEIYFAHIEPDFNVLPLILPHFENRYANQKWIIYDLKRKFGIFYNLQETNYISLDISKNIFDKTFKASIYSTLEMEFQELWKQYFKSTNIKYRKNLKLHTQHVPKRYWKYLSEKSSLHN